MARNPSAIKYHRQSERARIANKSKKSTIRTFTKKAVAATVAGDLEAAAKYHGVAKSLIDRAAKGSTLHKNTAARKKARLAKRLERLRNSEQAA